MWTVKERIAWLQKHRRSRCPDCGGTIGNHQVKYSGWCPSCGKTWRLVRNTRNWKVRWWYFTITEPKPTEPTDKG